jgi:hypothetical protein
MASPEVLADVQRDGASDGFKVGAMRVTLEIEPNP